MFRVYIAIRTESEQQATLEPITGWRCRKPVPDKKCGKAPLFDSGIIRAIPTPTLRVFHTRHNPDHEASTRLASMTVSQDLVSIIVPVYNAAEYLPRCLDSICGQTHTNLQIILVDDGSTDGSGTICDRYAVRDHRIQVIHQENQGISVAQNAGLDATRGTYLAFADNDDILDKKNIELLLHALKVTDADMSKARWQQFGPSQMDSIVDEASHGAASPRNIKVFANPFKAYQTYFCKSLRIFMDMIGKSGEVRYFNEANWCRLYKAELWEGIRFPPGRYAQDIMVAGPLYRRMSKVADINTVLYYWLQSPSSVTHSLRSVGFYRDNVAAGLANFELALDDGITPMRSYYSIWDGLRSETAAAGSDPQSLEELHQDRQRALALFHKMGIARRALCTVATWVRHLEKLVYDARVKNMA